MVKIGQNILIHRRNLKKILIEKHMVVQNTQGRNIKGLVRGKKIEEQRNIQKNTNQGYNQPLNIITLGIFV